MKIQWILFAIVALTYLGLYIRVNQITSKNPESKRPLWGMLTACLILSFLGLVPMSLGLHVILAAVTIVLYLVSVIQLISQIKAFKPYAKKTKLVVLHLVLISGSLLFLIPFIWLVVTSLKNDVQMAAYPPVWIPHPVKWSNYPDALKYLPPGTNYGLVSVMNTLIIAVMSVIGTVLSSSLVAYGFSRLKWPGRDLVFGLVLATMMLPDAVTMMPRFLIFRDLHWIDTFLPLWVPSFFGSAFNIFLLRQFFLGIPKELEEAAKIDGCGPLATWWKIMAFLGSWRDFMGPLIYISTPEKMPVSYVLQLYNSAHGGEPGLLMAATTLVVLPIIILFFFTQRYFIEGITLTGIGGR
jgi:multiple sugar transport system permease protein